jgi:hypothetical protein
MNNKKIISGLLFMAILSLISGGYIYAQNNVEKNFDVDFKQNIESRWSDKYNKNNKIRKCHSHGFFENILNLRSRDDFSRFIEARALAKAGEFKNANKIFKELKLHIRAEKIYLKSLKKQMKKAVDNEDYQLWIETVKKIKQFHKNLQKPMNMLKASKFKRFFEITEKKDFDLLLKAWDLAKNNQIEKANEIFKELKLRIRAEKIYFKSLKKQMKKAVDNEDYQLWIETVKKIKEAQEEFGNIFDIKKSFHKFFFEHSFKDLICLSDNNL